MWLHKYNLRGVNDILSCINRTFALQLFCILGPKSPQEIKIILSLLLHLYWIVFSRWWRDRLFLNFALKNIQSSNLNFSIFVFYLQISKANCAKHAESAATELLAAIMVFHRVTGVEDFLSAVCGGMRITSASTSVIALWISREETNASIVDSTNV